MGAVQVQEIQWKGLVEEANLLFQSQDWKAALVGYRQALKKAETLNEQQADCQKWNIPFVQIYIVSCMNIAHTHMELADFESAEYMLRRIFYYLLYLIEKEESDSLNLLLELKRSVLILMHFLGQQGKVEAQELLLQELPDQLTMYFSFK